MPVQSDIADLFGPLLAITIVPVFKCIGTALDDCFGEAGPGQCNRTALRLVLNHRGSNLNVYTSHCCLPFQNPGSEAVEIEVLEA